MSGAVAFLAGLGTGYLNERDRRDERSRLDAREQRQREREDAADARANEIYNFQKGERQRAVDQRSAMERAATPDAVVSGEVYQPAVDDEGNTMPANPTAGTAMVGARRFASQGLAQEAALQQANQRAQQLLDVQDPAGRMKRQTEATQGKAAQLQLSAAELQLKESARKALNEGVLEALQAASAGASPEQVKAIYNRNGDNRVAELQIEPFEFDHPTLGKQRSARIVGKFENGAPLQVQDAFASSLDLFGTAKKFDLLGQWARDKTAKDDKAADNKRADKALSLQEQQFNATRQHQIKMEGISRAAASAKSAPQGLSMADLKDGHKTIASTMNADYKAQIEAAMDPKAAEPLKRQRDAEIVQAQRLYTGAMMSGMALTGEQAIYALRNGTKGTAQVPAKDGSGVRTVQVVSVNGRMIPLADDIGFNNPAPPASQSAAPPAKTAAPPPGAARIAAAGVQQPIVPRQLAIFDKMPDAELDAYVKAGNEIAAEVMRRRAAAPVQVPPGMFQD